MFKKLVLLLPLLVSFGANYAMDGLLNPDFQRKMAALALTKKYQEEQKKLKKQKEAAEKKENRKSKKIELKKDEVKVVANPVFFNDKVPRPVKLKQLKKEKEEKEQSRNPQISLDSKQLEKVKQIKNRRSNSVDSASDFFAQKTEEKPVEKPIIAEVQKNTLTIDAAIKLQKKRTEEKAPKLTKRSMSDKDIAGKTDSFALYPGSRAEKSSAALAKSHKQVQEELNKAIKEKNPFAIQGALLIAKANPNECDEKGNTAVMQLISMMAKYPNDDNRNKYAKECNAILQSAHALVKNTKVAIDWTKKNNEGKGIRDLLDQYGADNLPLLQYLDEQIANFEEEVTNNKMIETVDLEGNTRTVTQAQAKIWAQERIKKGNKEDTEREQLEAAMYNVLEYPGLRDKKIQELQQEIYALEQKPTSAYVKNTISAHKEKIKNLRTIEQIGLQSSYYYDSLIRLAKDSQTLENESSGNACDRLNSIKDYLTKYMATMTEENRQEIKPELFKKWLEFLA